MYQQFGILFTLISTGYICKKRHIIDDGMNKSINKFIICIAYPCLILNRMGNLEMPEGIFENFIITALISLIMFLILGRYAYVYTRFRKYKVEDAPVAEFAMLAPNNGFIGFPVAFTFFGDLGLLYMIACNLSLNIIFFSYGIKLMQRGREFKSKSIMHKIIDFVTLLINPKISAALFGLLLCHYEIKFPQLISSYLSLLGGIATPMSMIFIGSTLASCKISDIIKNRFVIEAAVNKLLIAPIITLLIVWFLPLDPLVKTILIFCNAIPVAASVPIFSELYDRNKKMASEILFITTIISMISIPIAVWLLNKCFC